MTFGDHASRISNMVINIINGYIVITIKYF